MSMALVPNNRSGLTAEESDPAGGNRVQAYFVTAAPRMACSDEND